MRSNFLYWVLGIFALTTGMAHAQAACPSGTIPYGTGQDQSFCGPDNSQQQSTQQLPQAAKPLPPIWVDKYGAIATDLVRKSGGVSANAPSRSSAEQAAIATCHANGGMICKVEISYGDGCVALVGGDTGHNAKSGLTIDLATQAAMKVCKAADTHCQVTYTACSLPVRVQQ